MLSEEEVRCLKSAGKAVSSTLKLIAYKIHEGMPLVEICEMAEDNIRMMGCEPAFPCNVSVNSVAAHYTSRLGDASVLPPKGLVKIDVGAHVNGFIADAAITIALSSDCEPLVQAAEKALEAAISNMRAGVKISFLGSTIESTIRNFGFKPIRNLSGHMLKQYMLHGEKNIPNVPVESKTSVEPFEVYAVEPFATNGVGVVVDSQEVYIFRYVNPKKADKDEKSLLRALWSRFRGLPFCDRWIKDLITAEPRDKLLSLLSKGALYGYPVLVEKGRGLVAQAEHTVIVYEDGVEVTTLF
ncbi:MAG: type II methionyl aminopeptidase [Candidatus Nezhaarchaeota archaeon]|nr:type II methionyl aminopeptidase [Candidatus Nezhaarchaeota archaeon]